jgi:hypothetical protein
VAKTRSKSHRSSPRPRPAPRPSPRPASRAPAGAAPAKAAVAQEQARPLADEKWAETYPYVRGDLLRIFVLAAVLFGVIVVSPHVF